MLQALCDSGRTSRPELVRLTGLSRATVSSLVADLVAAGLVKEEQETADPQGRAIGRPPQALSLIPSAGYAAAVDIGHEHVRVALCDLFGTPVWDTFLTGDIDPAPEETLDTIAELIHRALRETGIAREDVLGLGADIAAPVHKQTGALEAHGIMPGWVGIQPAGELERRTGFATTVVNDADAGALGERLYGAGRTVEDMVYIRLSAGIGAGIVSGGKPLGGARGFAGEIGHLPSMPDGRVCRCGNRGCLETVASPVAIARLLADSWGRPVTTAELLRFVEDGDRGAVRAVKDAAHAVGRTLATLVTLVNPELIVVGGDLAGAGEVLFGPLRADIERHALASAADAVKVVRGELGDYAEVRGAAGLVLAQAPRILTARPTPPAVSA